MENLATANDINVILSDDHQIVRHAVRTILAGDPRFKVVGECSHAEETVEKVKALQPQILIQDLGLPGKSGVEVLYELQQAEVPTRAIVLTMYDDEGKVRQAFSAGARAYLLKNSSPEEFMEAISTVLAGNIYIPERFSEFADEIKELSKQRNGSTPTELDPLGKLSKREREIFYLLADGIPNRVIAKKLFISPRTVETHRARVIKKLGFSSTADLIRYAIRNNLMTL
jgi:DNA-binding NarL/FixJ family response regulator